VAACFSLSPSGEGWGEGVLAAERGRNGAAWPWLTVGDLCPHDPLTPTLSRRERRWALFLDTVGPHGPTLSIPE